MGTVFPHFVEGFAVAYVTVQFNGVETHRMVLDQPITIGRDLSNDIWLGDPKLSRSHCRIVPDGHGHWAVQDLQSHNGVYFHAKRTDYFTPHDGDAFTVGKATVTYHEGFPLAARPTSPVQTLHQSLMTPLVGPVSDHAAPAHAAKNAKALLAAKPAKVSLDVKDDEPLVKPFGLAFQRPAPNPVLPPTTQTKDEKPQPTQSSRSWLATLLASIRASH
jgi:hypothetical protein